MNRFVYSYGTGVYVNLTNRCSNACTFCVRQGTTFRDYDLWLEREPEAAEIIAQLEPQLEKLKQEGLVFCGFGEPLYRLDVMLEVADWAHLHGIYTRVNTNGQAGLIAGTQDAAKRMKGKLDKINVSLNASTAEGYQAVCRCAYGVDGYQALLKFASDCKAEGLNVVFSVVDVIGEEEVAACQALADSLGVPLRVRRYDP